jgi:hypothetical protein
MRLLNIVTSPRRERSASIAVIDPFLLEYQKRIKGVVVDTLDVWAESLPEFDAEAIGAKYRGVSGEAMTSSERATWKKIKRTGLTLSKGSPTLSLPSSTVTAAAREHPRSFSVFVQISTSGRNRGHQNENMFGGGRCPVRGL